MLAQIGLASELNLLKPYLSYNRGLSFTLSFVFFFPVYL